MKAVLLAIIHKIMNEGDNSPPGKKQLHKLVYLIQAKGLDLGYEYGIHFYGPYSDDLSRDLLSLCVNGDIAFRIEGQTHKIVPIRKPDDAEVNYNWDDVLVDRIINTYKGYNASCLELLTTTHFVAVNLGNSDKEILDGVKRIKGNKYPISDIMDAISHIRAEYSASVLNDSFQTIA